VYARTSCAQGKLVPVRLPLLWPTVDGVDEEGKGVEAEEEEVEEEDVVVEEEAGDAGAGRAAADGKKPTGAGKEHTDEDDGDDDEDTSLKAEQEVVFIGTGWSRGCSGVGGGDRGGACVEHPPCAGRAQCAQGVTGYGALRPPYKCFVLVARTGRQALVWTKPR
jgi:hypothetical protein